MKEKEKSITLGDIFRVLWKNIILLCAITVAVTVIGIIYTFAIAKPTYTSSSSVIVAVPQGSGVNSSESIRITVTVADTIKENAILKPVVDKYNEDIKDADQNGLMTIPGSTETITIKGRTLMNYETLKNMVSISQTTNSFKITITVSSHNKELAQYFAAAIQEQVIEEAVATKADGSTGVFFFLEDSISASSKAELGQYAKPNKKLYLIVAFLGGLVLACIVIFIKEFMSTKVKTKEEAELLLDEKVIGFFPNKDKKNIGETGLIEVNVRNMEPYNKLLSNIKYSNVEDPIKVIEITSTVPDELKSTTSANLALCIANNNQKVLIIDCDIRKAVQHRNFGVEKENGIVEYSVGEKEINDIIKHSSCGVDVITSGKDVINPVAILESSRVKNLIKELREVYDYIIVDAPPSLACSDPQIISTFADGVIYTVALNQAKKKDIIDSLSNLKNVDANVIGLSITKAETSKKDSYYYYYNKD